MLFRPIAWLTVSALIVTPLMTACSSSNGSSDTAVFDPVVLSMATTRAVALGDIDGDGDADQVFGNDGEPDQIYLNDGSGHFSDSGRVLGNELSKTFAIALVDVDGDGDRDLMAGRYGETNVLYLNDGVGHFSDSNQAAFTSANTNAIALDDIDGDNFKDLVVGNYLDNDPNTTDVPNQVFINDGNGVFTEVSLPLTNQTFTTSKTLAVALGDLNRDGLPDLVVGYEGAPTEVYWNTSSVGTISFNASPTVLADSNARGFAIADVDGDNFPDLAVAPSSLYLNSGTQMLTDISQVANQMLSGSATVSVLLVDVDDDQDNDLIAGISNAPDRVFTNDGTGLFAQTTQVLGGSLASNQGIAPGGTNTMALAAGYINNDNFIDFVSGNYEQVNRSFFNDQTGIFVETPQLPDSSNTFALVCSDLNDDVFKDLVAGNSGQTNRVYFGSAQGQISDSLQLIGNSDTRAIAVGDLDGNGFPDLVTGNFGEPNLIYPNAGTGHFDEPAAQSIGTAATRVVVLADVDNDNDLDLVVGNHGEADQVFINEGYATGVINFIERAQPNFDVTGITGALALGDLDFDTDLDLIVGVDGGPNRVFFNQGLDTGIYVDSGQLLDNVTNSNTVSVVLGDIDNDDDLDLVVGNNMEQAGAVYKNDGLGNFTDTGQSLGQSQTSVLKLADIDKDGDLDLIEGNYAGANYVYKNDGNGNFSFNLEALGHENTNALDLCDIDGDKDLDLVEGNFGQINWTFKNLTVR